MMFTGLIEETAAVLINTGSKLTLKTGLAPLIPGDSVSVNGICLTVTGLKKQGSANLASFDYSPETARMTTLADIKNGSRVNLERAMRADSRFGGHIVTGHIEGTAKLIKTEKIDNSVVYLFSHDPDLSRYIVQKGSIAVDGISLTVTACSKGSFSVTLIPFTLNNTNLPKLKPADLVNIETDILAKYAGNNGSAPLPKNALTKDFLKANGFM